MASRPRPPRLSDEPMDGRAFTRRHDRAYTAFAGLYETAVRRLPVWRTWLGRALPHVTGPRVLEVSFGTGHLLARYAHRVEAHGVDLNRAMVDAARGSLARAGCTAALVRGNVEALPYPDDAFDSLVNTMAFSGYPDGHEALAEMKRVLRPAGRLVLIDFAFPADGNRVGAAIASFWKLTGDLIRDMPALFAAHGLEASDEAIGGFGSVHLWVAQKPARDAPGGPA